jgi:hypothetical protein
VRRGANNFFHGCKVSIVNRNFLVSVVALGALAALGPVYSKLTVAAPAPAPAPETGTEAAATTLPARRSLPASSATAMAAPIAAATSPEVARLDARRQLYESVDALVQASEFEKARKLLDEDQDRYGDDLAPEWRDLEQSYRLMADCLEHPTAKQRVRAEAFVLVTQALSLKPRILAACTGNLATR